MRKIRKMQSGFSFPSLSSEFITGASYIKLTPYINSLLQQYITKTGNFTPIKNPSSTNNTGNLAVANGINAISSQLTQRASDKIFGDSELGRGLGTLFSSGVNSATNTMGNNILKGAALSEGVMQNAGASLAGAGAGLAANYIGLGINSLGGNSMLSRGIGLGVATGLGTVGGTALSNLITSGSVAGNASKLFGTAGKGWQAFSTGKTGIDAAGNVTKAAGAINPYALGATVLGSALGAATGPSKEYGGRYGKITQGMDMAYDALSVGANFIPGIGLGISAAMVLNKGLSNIFGSTSGMTKTDAILGSAFMPAPVKWLNMAGAHKTGTFNNLSWQNQEKASSFMQDAFGNLLDKFDKAREEAGKTYGTFSRGAYNRAQNNLNFANKAWGQIMAMADLNELLNIRSLYMTSINNLRYAQMIQGGWSPLVRGKQGMKILNNATNHNMGMRLLSAAALIDNKQMILSALNGTKIKKKGIKYGIPVEYLDASEVMPDLANNMGKSIVLDEVEVTPSRRLPIQDALFEGITNQAANERADKYANRTSLTPGRFLGLMGANVPLAAGALGATVAAPALFDSTIAPLSDYVAGTKAGQAITGLLGNPYFNAAVEAGFAGHGLNHTINEGVDGWGDAAMTALEVAPLGRLAKPVWNASKEGLQYTAKVADNTARYVSPSYDLYRTIGETTPRTTPTLHSFYSSDLTGSGFVENVYTGSPLFEFGQTMRTSPEKAYFMRAPKDVDILKLENGKFRHEVVGNEIFPSGEVNGKFVSYGEPWKEFALGENSALYEFPVGPRRGPSLMATDWKGREQKYSVDEVYDYMQQEEALRKELASIKETVGDDFLKQYRSIRRNLIDEKYPALKEPIDTSIHGANQTVIPNERWNFDKFLKTPFWKYSENPISGQVQKELMMRWPEAKPLETPTILYNKSK